MKTLQRKKTERARTAQMVVGIEDELPLCALSHSGKRMADPAATARLIDLAKQQFRHLPLTNRELGVALSNGSFLYQDVSHGGAHSEICTPECLDPKSVVIAREAGFANVKTLCEKDPGKEWRIFRHCVDPTSGSSWATHCSVDTNESFQTIESAFVPFIASKLIFAGCGGFSDKGGFTIAPRLCQFGSITGTNTEAERPLICARKKPLVDGLRRQEFICHESLRSHVACVLDYGVTMLVMILVNNGINPGIEVSLESPLDALRLFSSDPRFKVKAMGVEPGRSFTALDIQKHYLDEVGARLGEPWMPAWAKEVVILWQETLDLLALGHEAAADRLDWCIKLQIFQSWNKGKFALKRNPNLMELDIRFGEMDQGLFDQMDKAGLLPGHHVDGIDSASIQKATVEPPPTRAQLRGFWIDELSGHNSGYYYASWDSIVDRVSERQLQFTDRTGTEPVEWEEIMPGQNPSRRSRSMPSPIFGLGSVLCSYQKGRFATGLRILSEIESRFFPGNSSELPPYDYFRYSSWLLAKLGRDVEAIDSLERLRLAYPDRESSLIGDHVVVLSSFGLFGTTDLDSWIEKGTSIPAGPVTSEEDCIFLTNSALRRLRTGDNELARPLLECCLEPASQSVVSTHTLARAHTLMGEWYRLEGRIEEAESQLRSAEVLYRVNDFRSEYADFYLTTSAKLSFDQGRTEEAVATLTQASELQIQLELPGDIRSSLLLARFRGDDGENARKLIQVKAARFASFASCPFLPQLLEPEAWKEFVSGTNQAPWMRAI